MEWLIPTQTLQVDNIQFGTLIQTSKPLVPLAYKDNDIRFSSLSLLLPILTIKSYDKMTGQLILFLGNSQHTLTKLALIQEMFISAVELHHNTWFPSRRANVNIKSGFQQMIRGSEIHLYCPTQSEIMQSVPFFHNDMWSTTGIQKELLVAGKQVRIAVRIQGISFLLQQNSDIWSGKYRIQHKILSILLK
jgi:hypothetical protein|uniref:Uncharacterized protein n=1 Tax=viral metagenome TaxID=1070528 RepID=A0A6C0K824_9ZZZZ